MKKITFVIISWFDSPPSLLSLYNYIHNQWSRVVKRSRSWKTYLCTYLGWVSWMLQFTPFQPSGWTWLHPFTLHTLKQLTKIIPRQTLPYVHFGFDSRSLIISLEDISPVSTYCSRAGFWVGVHHPYPLFLVLFNRLHIFIIWIRLVPSTSICTLKTKYIHVSWRTKN